MDSLFRQLLLLIIPLTGSFLTNAYYSFEYEMKNIQERGIEKSSIFFQNNLSTKQTIHFLCDILFLPFTPNSSKFTFFSHSSPRYMGGILAHQGKDDQWWKNNTLTYFENLFKQYFEDTPFLEMNKKNEKNSIDEYIKKSFESVHTSFSAYNNSQTARTNGISALIFYVYKQNLYIAHCGDNRAIWGKNETERTEAHTEAHSQEDQRLLQLKFTNKNTQNTDLHSASLTTTRLIGASAYQCKNNPDSGILTCEPEVIRIPLSADLIFLLGNKNVFDYLDSYNPTFPTLMYSIANQPMLPLSTIMHQLLSFLLWKSSDNQSTYSKLLENCSDEKAKDLLIDPSNQNIIHTMKKDYADGIRPNSTLLLIRVIDHTKTIYMYRILLLCIAYVGGAYWYKKKLYN